MGMLIYQGSAQIVVNTKYNTENDMQLQDDIVVFPCSLLVGASFNRLYIIIIVCLYANTKQGSPWFC